MIEKVLCPYCGAEMKSSGWVSLINGNLAYTVCSNNRCKSAGPYVRGYETMAEARAAALAAAQARYLPPNRPLTMAEVKALDRDDAGFSCVWMEDRRVYDANGQACEDYPYPVVTAECIPNSKPYYKKYGIEYRVWLRKPTQAEMDAAGWEGDAADD